MQNLRNLSLRWRVFILQTMGSFENALFEGMETHRSLSAQVTHLLYDHPVYEAQRQREGGERQQERQKQKPEKQKEQEKQKQKPEKQKEKEKQKERQRQRQEEREATGKYNPIPIHCDICGNNRWNIDKKFEQGNMVVIDVDCINGRMGAIAVEKPADISTKVYGFSPIVVTCGNCGKSDKFKPLGKVPVMAPGKGKQSVRIECSCGKKYKLTTYDHKIGSRMI